MDLQAALHLLDAGMRSWAQQVAAGTVGSSAAMALLPLMLSVVAMFSRERWASALIVVACLWAITIILVMIFLDLTNQGFAKAPLMWGVGLVMALLLSWLLLS